jgi:hypothetical protein
MKNSYDTIGNRSHDLPVYSAEPQPLRHRVPRRLRYRLISSTLLALNIKQNLFRASLLISSV